MGIFGSEYMDENMINNKIKNKKGILLMENLDSKILEKFEDK